MSFPGASRYWAVECDNCGLHFDPEFILHGLCPDCRENQWRRNVVTERG